MDSSDTSVNLVNNTRNLSINEHDNFKDRSNITEKKNSDRLSEIQWKISKPPGQTVYDKNGNYPGTSGQNSTQQIEAEQRERQAQLDHAKADEIIKEAERLKAEITRPPGIASLSVHTYSGCDDAFFQSITHVDKATRDKIKRRESVDLLKLLPHNKYQYNDHKMELLSNDGSSFFVPIKMQDHETMSINSYNENYR